MQRYPVTMLVVFGLTMFVSASLLFLVQPMIGKLSTPLLGGTPAVWNTCMVFFQAALLAGYAYAHGTTRWLGARRQAVLHLAVLVVPFLFFPLSVHKELIRGDEENPVPALLLLLTVTVGVPFFVVSTTAPLLQKWFASTSHPAARDPYFLYGSSNLGSMAVLIGYPFIYEYFVPLSVQQTVWPIGFAVLVVLIGVCAVLLWLSPPQVATATPTTPDPKPADAFQPSAEHRQSVSGQQGKGRRKVGKRDTFTTAPPKAVAPTSTPITQAITWPRRLRWVLLAAVPSSLMLGVTTYLTTDIAAISYLWLPPLTLYLLTFIIVFARVPPLVHRTMVIVLPLLVLLLTFMMISDFRPTEIVYNIAIHLVTMFVVAMVCHGELARDRPTPRHLTEFFLWMSVGGVLGGLFNALVAPLIFFGNAEYSLALVAACLLLPSLGWDRGYGNWVLYADIGLAVFCSVIGLVLIGIRLLDHHLDLNHSNDVAAASWSLAALVAATGFVLVRFFRARERRPSHLFDLLLPVALMVLVIGMTWGFPSDTIKPRFIRMANLFDIEPLKLRAIITYGIPAILCYTFVERSTRFGLGLGAILLASLICNMTDTSLLFQTRSFYGVLRVEFDGPFIRLLHGTTLHGVQYRREFPEGELYYDYPFTYYDRAGPVGRLFDAYSYPQADALGAGLGSLATATRKLGIRPNLGVIGLGTGTMACYGEPGQHMTFYDIDPAVRDISFNNNSLFTYVQDARERGVVVEDLVLGDARLTMQRQRLTEDQKYGILIVDAFSSDAIPIHLINQEAIRVFLDKMNPNGIIAFHISNRHLDLLPVLANVAEAENLVGVYKQDSAEVENAKAATTWVLLARQPEHLERLPSELSWEQQTGMRDWNTLRPALRIVGSPAASLQPYWKDLAGRRDPAVGVWSDDYSNLLSVFRWQ